MKMNFIIDENVPNSVLEIIRHRGHNADSIRKYVVEGSPDELVAVTAEQFGAILIGHDSDFKKIAPRIPDGQRTRFRKISMIRMRCEKPKSAIRLLTAMPLIDFSFSNMMSDGAQRLIIEVKKEAITVFR